MLTQQLDGQIREFLQQHAAFSMLDDAGLEEVIDHLEMVNVPMGTTIINEGDEADCAFLLYTGKARVVKTGETGKPLTLNTMTPGAIFGEQAILSGQPRSASVRASEDCLLFRISREDFLGLLERNPLLKSSFERVMSQRAVRDFLQLTTFLGALPARQLNELLDQMEPCEFARGEVIIRQGEPGDRMFIILAGKVKVTRTDNGTEEPLAELAEGMFFGEKALITSEPRAATVTAVRKTQCLSLSRDQLDRLMHTAPEVREQLVKRIEYYAGQAELAKKFGVRTPERVERKVLAFAPTVGKPLASLATPTPAAVAAEPAKTAKQRLKKPSPFRLFRRFPFIPQQEETDCGAASLAMISKYYGIRLSVGELRELANVGREGASLYSLAEAAEKLGYVTRAVRTDYDNLKNVETPCVAHWMGYHYIVLYEVRGDRVTVGDPAVGIVKMTRAEFEKGWTGRLLLLTPTPKLEEHAPAQSTFRRFLPMLTPFRLLLLEILLASLLLELFQLASPIFSQTIVDKVLVHQNVSMLNLMLGGMIIIGVFQTLTILLRQYLVVHVSQKLELRMSTELFRQIMRLPMRFFHTRHVGDLLQRFQDNDKLQQFLAGQSISTILDVMMLVTSLGLMLYYNASLTLVALATVPLYVVITLVFTPLLKRISQKEFEHEARTESSLIESITSISAIKQNTAERTRQWKHEELIVRTANAEVKAARLQMAMQALSSSVQIFSSTFLLWYGAHLVMKGQLTVGQLMAFNSLIGQVTTPIMGLIGLWDSLQDALLSLRRLNDLYDAKPEQDPAAPAVRLPRVRGYIKFENVSFRYDPDGNNILTGINLEIQPGETVALVGRSGSGKTTLAMLLQRFYNPTEGRILVDGVDLANVDLRSFRNQVGTVSQENVLFSATVRENIGMSDPEAPFDRIMGAARLASAHDFILNLPMGYDTLVGETGVRLSGGQKQRVSIARALLRDPQILVFDEATSALDTESEKAIQDNLKPILKQRTAIVIAHRLSTIQDADTIVVLDQGTIVEKGTHRELVDKRGLYYYLVSQQLSM